MTKEEYYQGRYRYWLKLHSAPDTGLIDIAIEAAAREFAKVDTNAWWIQEMGPQIQKCCDDFVTAFQDVEFDYEQDPTVVTLHGSSTVIQYCPFCGTKITPWKYYSPQDNPFNNPEAGTPQ